MNATTYILHMIADKQGRACFRSFRADSTEPMLTQQWDSLRFASHVARSRSGSFLHNNGVGCSGMACNSRMRSGGVLTIADIARTKPSQYCDKCFSQSYAERLIAAAKGAI